MIFNEASSTLEDSQKLQELKIEPHQFHQQLHHSYRKFDKPSEAQPTGHTLRFLSLPNYLDAKNEAKITSVVEKEMVESRMQKLAHMENSSLINMLMETMPL